MAYHAHDGTGMDSYSSGGHDMHVPFIEEDEHHYNSGNYSSKDDLFSGDYRKKDEEEAKRKLEPTEFEKRIEEAEKPKYDKDNGQDDVIKKVAEELRMDDNSTKITKKKVASSIEKAIEDAIKEEQEVIHL